MANLFTLRNMWRDSLTRKNLKVTDLESDVQALIGEFETKETAYNAKVTSWEAAKANYETLQRELTDERSKMISMDSKINHSIMMVRTTPANQIPPVTPES